MNNEKEFLRSIYAWRELRSSQLDSFEEELRPLCEVKTTKKTLNDKYQGKFHLAILNPNLFTHAIRLSDTVTLHGWATKSSEVTGHDCIETLCQHEGRFLQKKCSKELTIAMEILLKRGVIFSYHKHYCLPLEFFMKGKGCQDDHTWLNICKNMSLDMLKTLVSSEIKKEMRQSPLAHELATQMYLFGMQQLATFQADRLGDFGWDFLFDLHTNNDSIDVESLKQMLDEKSTSIKIVDMLSSKKFAMLNQFFQMGFIGIEPEQTHHGYYRIAERLVISHEAKAILKPYWPKQQQRIIDMMKRTIVVDEPKEYQTSTWDNDHQLWRMWVTLQFISISLTQQDSWRVSDIKKTQKVLPDLSQDDLYDLINAILVICGGIKQRTLHLKMLSSKAIAMHMQTYLFRQTRVESKPKDMQYAAKILCQLPEGQWLDMERVLTLLSMMNASKHPVHWEGFFKPHIRSPYHFNEDEAVICLLPQFKAWLQGKEMPLSSPGWRSLKKDAATAGYISAAGDIQLPPETSADIYADLATFCQLVSVEHMVNVTLDQKAIKALSLKPKELAKAKKTLERIQSPLPQAVSYLFERELNQKVIAKVTATSALVEIKDPSAFNQLNKIGKLSACPNKKNAWLLQPTDSAASFIATCRKQGLKVEGSQDEQQNSATSTAWIEGFYSIRTWVNNFNPEGDGAWLEIIYQKRSADALKTCYAYYVESDYWNNYLSLRLVKSARKGLALIKRATKFDHQHLHKVRLLSEQEIKALNLKDL